MKPSFTRLLALVGAVFLAGAAVAQDYPAKTIHIVGP
jgi:hypothetical protein